MVAFLYDNRYNKISILVIIILFKGIQSKPNDAKIIDGRDVTGDEGSFMAGLLRYPDGQLICSAAFYTSTLLITACSCIIDAAHSTEVDFPEQSPNGFRVSAGSKYSVKLEENQALLEVAKLITHPQCEYDYYLDMWKRDLGIVIVRHPVNASLSLKYIPYPHPDQYFHSLLSILEDNSYWIDGDKSCYIYGWGYTSYMKNRNRFMAFDPVPFLKTRAMQIMFPDECQEELCQVNERVCQFWPGSHLAFCAMARDPGKGSFCLGDIGAPFVCDGVLYGIASWNYDCATDIKANVIYELDIMFIDAYRYLSSSLCNRTNYIFMLILFFVTTVI